MSGYFPSWRELCVHAYVRNFQLRLIIFPHGLCVHACDFVLWNVLLKKLFLELVLTEFVMTIIWLKLIRLFIYYLFLSLQTFLVRKIQIYFNCLPLAFYFILINGTLFIGTYAISDSSVDLVPPAEHCRAFLLIQTSNLLWRLLDVKIYFICLWYLETPCCLGIDPYFCCKYPNYVVGEQSSKYYFEISGF